MYVCGIVKPSHFFTLSLTTVEMRQMDFILTDCLYILQSLCYTQIDMLISMLSVFHFELCHRLLCDSNVLVFDFFIIQNVICVYIVFALCY